MGSALLSTKRLDGRTRNDDLIQIGCAKIRVPSIHNPAQLEAVMINTAGWVTGGDRLDWHFAAGAETRLTVTSQACERLYKSTGQRASIAVDLRVETGAQLNWLPQETILFDHCNAHRKIDADLNDNARLLLVEPHVFGRRAMNEVVRNCFLQDDWRIRHRGMLVHSEALRLEGDMDAHLQQIAVASAASAVAAIVLLETLGNGRLESCVQPARDLLGSSGGVSLIKQGQTGKLIARLVAKDSYTLRKSLIPLIQLLNEGAQMPKCWAL